MSTPAKKATKKEKKKPVPVKTSLTSPYRPSWTAVGEKGDKSFILNTLKCKISAIGLQHHRPNRLYELANRRKSRKKTSNQTENPKLPTESVQPLSNPTEPTNMDQQPTSWTNMALRKQLAIGINEVTKGLERNKLSLVLVCQSVRPEHMTLHLIPLSRTRSVPVCQVSGLSDSLSGLLGLKSVLAVGFKRGGEAFEDVVRAITPVVPPLDVAWIPTESTLNAEEKNTGTGIGTEKGLKRKLEDVSDEASDASPVILQPLKVKKIIPNPRKIRKPKKKGKQKCLSSV